MTHPLLHAPLSAFRNVLVPAVLICATAGLGLAQDGHGQGDGHNHGNQSQGVGDEVPDLPPGEGPRLTWDFGTDKIDFGSVMQGDILEHTFEMQSGGTEELVIKQAKPTCGCTVADVLVENDAGEFEIYKMGAPIPVGHKIRVNARLATKSKRGAASSRINIFSTDPRGQRTLGLTANVATYFQVNPTHIAFKQMSTRDTGADKARISTTNGLPIKLEMRDAPKPKGLTVSLSPEGPDENGRSKTWTVDVAVGPGLNEGNLAYSIVLISDQPIPGVEPKADGTPATYEVTVTVMGRVTGMISVNPSLISLGLVRPGQVASRTVRVTSHDPDFEIAEPKVHLENRQGEEWDLGTHFSTVLRPVAGENAVDIELRLDGMPDTLNSSFSGMLVIETGHEDKGEVKLPISGVCRGGIKRPSNGAVRSTGGK